MDIDEEEDVDEDIEGEKPKRNIDMLQFNFSALKQILLAKEVK